MTFDAAIIFFLFRETWEWCRFDEPEFKGTPLANHGEAEPDYPTIAGLHFKTAL